MEAAAKTVLFSGNSIPLLLKLKRSIPLRLRLRPRHHAVQSYHFPSFIATISASSNPQGLKGAKPKRNVVAEWVLKNDEKARSLPIYVGCLSLVAVLFNRAVSGIAPVVDASSSQSRADLLALGLAVTNILTGLVWLSIRPKSISVVNPQGVYCQRVCSHLPDTLVSEILWFWESISAITCCRSLVMIYNGNCMLQVGVAAESGGGEAVAVDAARLVQGSLYQGVMKSGSQSYLANLSLYPGRSELPFLPSNTQAVILQPLGDKGIAILGGDTIRGFTTSDQAWISLIADKLDATLSRSVDNIRKMKKVPYQTGLLTTFFGVKLSEV